MPGGGWDTKPVDWIGSMQFGHEHDGGAACIAALLREAGKQKRLYPTLGELAERDAFERHWGLRKG